MKSIGNVPNSLKIWFLIHFILDYLFAVPLILFPSQFLKFLGWITIDNLSARLIGSALIGIGGVSLLQNKSNLDSYNSLLTLKILWSIAAIISILISISEGAPEISWLILIIFLIFSSIWIYYKIKIKKIIK